MRTCLLAVGVTLVCGCAKDSDSSKGGKGTNSSMASKLARAQAKQLATEAYLMWARDAGEACPRKLEELLKFINRRSTRDPWNEEFVMVCGETRGHGIPAHVPFGVLSKGPDRKLGTKDDIRSWAVN